MGGKQHSKERQFVLRYYFGNLLGQVKGQVADWNVSDVCLLRLIYGTWASDLTLFRLVVTVS